MKFLALLALAAAATAAVMPNAATPDATNMAVDQQAEQQQAAPQADASSGTNAQPQGWYPPPPPPPPPTQCRPGTYSCTTTNNGFRVCDYSGHWVVSVSLPLGDGRLDADLLFDSLAATAARGSIAR